MPTTLVYLITNWHNVSGRNPETGNCYHNQASIPNNFRIYLHQKQPQPDRILLSSIKAIDIPLFHSEEFTWKEHPDYKKRVDVVGIPINLPEDVKYGCLNDVQSNEYIPEVGDDVFILGYPWGLHGGSRVLPIWKRGTIATEPTINYSDLPRMLIDSRSTSGMSGSPVICKHDGIYNPKGQDFGNAIIGTITCFLGVYSGRLLSQYNTEPEKEISDLGIVWKHTVIEEIIGS